MLLNIECLHIAYIVIVVLCKIWRKNKTLGQNYYDVITGGQNSDEHIARITQRSVRCSFLLYKDIFHALI